jgi:lysozyme family protein
VTLAEAKAHLRVDSDVEDTLISSLIITSRLHIEAALGLAFITQGWSYFIDCWPANHGVDAAARMLQQAVGAGIDGEIGAATLAAVAARPVRHILAAYAEIRRQRYRSLAHFWRFGKGWLRRVDATLALAASLDRATPSPSPSQPKEKQPMSTETSPATEPATDVQPKWWATSMTVWGIAVTALSTVLPALGPLLGLNLTAELIRQLGDNVVVFGQALGGLVGTVLAIYGRVRASAPLQRRQVTLNL